MKRFRYEVIADKIAGNQGGYGSLTAKAITIHHTGVETVAPYDIMNRLAVYTRGHDGHFPYQFYIPMDDGDGSLEQGEDVIYVTNWLNQFVIHNANWDGNRNCLSGVLEGNFQVQKPTELQLAKLKQLLDDLSIDYLENVDGYIDSFKQVNPKDNQTVYTFSGVRVNSLHYHNEVAQPGNGTACCGTNLIPYVVDYRSKAGNVNWGLIQETPRVPESPEYVRNQKDFEVTRYVALENVALVDLSNDQKVKTFNAGDVFEISRITYKAGIAYAISKYSADRNIYNGFELSKLVTEKEMEDLKAKVNDLTNKVSELETDNQKKDEKIKSLESDIQTNATNHNAEVLKLQEEVDNLFLDKQSLEKENAQLKGQIAEGGNTPLPDNSEVIIVKKSTLKGFAQKFMAFWESKGVTFTRVVPYLLAAIPGVVVFLNDPNVSAWLTTYGVSAVLIIRMLEAVSDVAKKKETVIEGDIIKE